MAREGAKVLCTDINGDGAQETAARINAECGAGTAFAMQHDVTSPDEWDAAIEMAHDALGGLSVLVNNAGVGVRGNIETCTLEEWRRGFAINVESVFLGCQKALPLMKDNQPGIDHQHQLDRGADRERHDARLQRQQGGGVDAVEVGRALLRQDGLEHPLQFGPPDLRRHPDPRRNGAFDRARKERDHGQAGAADPAEAGRRAREIADGVLFLASDESRAS